LGSRASGLEDDIHRSPQGSLQHDKLEEEHNVYFEPLFEGSDELVEEENVELRIKLVSSFSWLSGEVTIGAGADGAGVNGAGADRGLPRLGGCWEVTG